MGVRRNSKHVEWSSPASLHELFDVFDRLEQNVSVALTAANGGALISQLELSSSALGGWFPPSADQGPMIGVWSSGSTGKPKLVWKPWRALTSSVSTSALLAGWNWASPFSPTSFAGVHVALQAWSVGGKIFPLSRDWGGNWSALTESCVGALSCTPTFLDLLLQSETPAAGAWSPDQITLGGERLHPRSAERALRRFPSSRFTIIYASAEFGVMAKTHRLDGRFECESFDRHCAGWRLVDGVLEIRAQGKWRSSGDNAEMSDGLIRITGRAGVANVGGVKVNLEEIEVLAEEVPGVATAVATVEPSAVVGEIVSLAFALERGFDAVQTESELRAHLRRALPKEAWPRRWIRRDVGLGQNAKRSRG